MDNVIFKGRDEAFQFDPDMTQSLYEDTQFAGHDEDEDDHGNSWHVDDDLYCEDEEEEADILAESLVFIDELTQSVEAQKRRQSIHARSYTQLEDRLICKSCMQIGQDPIEGAEQKSFVFWSRVHTTFR
ncbi:putative MO25-like protein [Hordeum vulgare]|nr:putative MO25-like protein [Hordeum vulgare]